MVRTVFHGGRVFDGTAEPARGDVVIEGDRIVDVGLDLDGDVIIDATGLTITPGLFDCHVHVIYGHMDVLRFLQEAKFLYYYAAGRNLRDMLNSGITTVRDAAGADLSIKQAVQRGLIPGPRMHISITMLSQTAGHADAWMPCGLHTAHLFSHPMRPEPLVDGPEVMRRRVRELARAGADVIKIAASGGVLSPGDDPRDAHFLEDELDMAVRAARAHRLDVMAHAQSTEGIKNAVHAGVRSIEHGLHLDEEGIEMMLAREVWLVPTLLVLTRLLPDDGSRPAGMLDASFEKACEAKARQGTALRMAVEAGVPVAMGTDLLSTPMDNNLDELGLMVASGMAPLDAWRAASSSAARMMRRDDLGHIAPGRRADLVAFSGDFFDFEALASRVQFVFQDGQHVAPRIDLPRPLTPDRQTNRLD